MICFPLDNTEYEAIALGAWCGTRTRGVFSDDGHYAVTANGNMTVTVSPGLAWLKADEHWGINMFEPNPTVLIIDTADGQLSRTDAVCLRYDKNQNAPSLIIKKGAYTPQPPVIAPIARNIDYDEIYVAAVHVRNGATSILQADIEDLRLKEAYCGIMRDGVTGIPTQALYDQWHSWFAEFQDSTQQYFEEYQQLAAELYTQYQAEIAAHEGNADAAYDAYVTRMSTYEADAKADWEAWVASLKDILDEEVAGNHELRLEALEERVPTVDLGTIDTASATDRLYPQCGLFASSWAYGIGGAGVGPAGGTSVQAIEAGYAFDVHDVTVSAAAQYQAFKIINQISGTMFAFLSDVIAETRSLVLQIYK